MDAFLVTGHSTDCLPVCICSSFHSNKLNQPFYILLNSKPLLQLSLSVSKFGLWVEVTWPTSRSCLLDHISPPPPLSISLGARSGFPYLKGRPILCAQNCLLVGVRKYIYLCVCVCVLEEARSIRSPGPRDTGGCGWWHFYFFKPLLLSTRMLLLWLLSLYSNSLHHTEDDYRNQWALCMWGHRRAERLCKAVGWMLAAHLFPPLCVKKEK